MLPCRAWGPGTRPCLHLACGQDAGSTANVRKKSGSGIQISALAGFLPFPAAPCGKNMPHPQYRGIWGVSSGHHKGADVHVHSWDTWWQLHII